MTVLTLVGKNGEPVALPASFKPEAVAQSLKSDQEHVLRSVMEAIERINLQAGVLEVGLELRFWHMGAFAVLAAGEPVWACDEEGDADLTTVDLAMSVLLERLSTHAEALTKLAHKTSELIERTKT